MLLLFALWRFLFSFFSFCVYLYLSFSTKESHLVSPYLRNMPRPDVHTGLVLIVCAVHSCGLVVVHFIWRCPFVDDLWSTAVVCVRMPLMAASKTDDSAPPYFCNQPPVGQNKF